MWGVTDVLCEACDQLGWKTPTRIQIEAVPVALQASTRCPCGTLINGPVGWPSQQRQLCLGGTPAPDWPSHNTGAVLRIIGIHKPLHHYKVSVIREGYP
ncbi:hypothetical protein Y1Q_0020079 [Alligator mississippiensis]|uniref:RNA helicase n=1 Tax=Alligator mississippiensis TaxID=8496 RepID=A0A151LYZ8_ALLMI|nr:hypothetical protein Y1Q_0020079 [Alligator mississippiensis]